MIKREYEYNARQYDDWSRARIAAKARPKHPIADARVLAEKHLSVSPRVRRHRQAEDTAVITAQLVDLHR